MSLTRIVRILELQDARISPMTADTGGAPTYGASIDLPGIVKIELTPVMDNKELFGDNTLLDIWSRVTKVEIDVECAELSLDAIRTIMGGVVTLTGTTPNQRQTFALRGTDSMPGYFRIQGRWLYTGTGAGDAHIVLHKVKTTEAPSFEAQGADGSFGTVSFKGVAIPATSNSSWFDIMINETATPIT